MTRDELVLTAKLGSALGLVGLHAALAAWARRRALSEAQVTRLAWACWWTTRPGLFVLAFIVLGMAPTSDVIEHYVPQGLAALRGELPYRDFDSSYGPLFPYVIAGVLRVIARPEAVVLLAVLFDGLAMRLWLRATESAVPARARAEGLLLYACAPVVVWNTALVGQNQVWLSAGLAGGVWLLTRAAPLRAGLVFALGALAVKVLGLLLVPYAVLVSAPRARVVLSLAVVLGLAVVLVPFASAGAAVWQPLTEEAARATSGNVPFLLGLLGLDSTRAAARPALAIVVALSLLGASAFAARRVVHARGPAAHHAALCVVMLVLMLASKKAYATYLVIFWLPMCLVLAQQGLSRAGLVAFGAVSVLATIEPALWFAWLHQASLPEALSTLARGGVSVRGTFSTTKVALFIACELGLLSGYAWLLRRASSS
jgi:hypothetical protein